MKVLDYIADPVKSKIVFMLREPPLSYVENVYTLPFDNKVWATCGLLMLISVILFYVVARWENHTKQMKEDYIENSTPLLQPKVADVVLFEVGALCQQGAEVEPRSAAGRTLTIFIFILITFLYTAYTAFIVALFQSTTDSIKTVEDLLTSDIKLGVQNEPYALPVFSSIVSFRRLLMSSMLKCGHCAGSNGPDKESALREEDLSEGKHGELYGRARRHQKNEGRIFCVPRGIRASFQDHKRHVRRESKVWHHGNRFLGNTQSVAS